MLNDGGRFLLDLHWNEEKEMYCDVSVNDDGKYCFDKRLRSLDSTKGVS